MHFKSSSVLALAAIASAAILPRQQGQGPYEIYACTTQLPELEGKPINACGRGFWIGGGACTYCPTNAGDICEKVSNKTVLIGSSMSVVVPGGQQGYVETTGAPGFTQAHSISRPPFAYDGGFGANAKGEFVWNVNGTTGRWLGCPGTQGYQLTAEIPGNDYSPGCITLKVHARFVAQGTFGAWQYT